VLFKLLVEAIAELAAGDEFAFASGEWRGVDHESHGERRLVDGDGREGDGMFGVGEGVADFDLLAADDGAQVPRFHMVHFNAAEALESPQTADDGVAPV